MDQAVISREDFRVFELDSALAVGRDGEDAGLHRALAEVFKQGRVAPLGDDVGVNLFRFVGIQNLGFNLFAVHPHGKVVHQRIFGNREDVHALGRPAVRVVKQLIDFGDGNLILNRHRHPVIFDFELVGNGERRAGFRRQAGRRRARSFRQAGRRVNDDDAVGEGGEGSGEKGEECKSNKRQTTNVMGHGEPPK